MSEIETVSDERLRMIIEDNAGASGQAESGASDVLAIATELLSRRSLDTADGVEAAAWKHKLTGVIRTDKPAVAMGLHEDYTPLFASRTRSTEVVVKALVWQKENVDGTVWTGVVAISGQYMVLHGAKGWEASRGMIRFGWFDTCETAKEVCQADFDQRIRSALASPPSPAEVTNELRKVAEKMLAYRNVEYVPNVLFEQLEAALDQLGKEG